jgi:hypothetical protein
MYCAIWASHTATQAIWKSRSKPEDLERAMPLIKRSYESS